MPVLLNRRGFIAATAAATTLIPARAALAESHGGNVVQMLNKDPDNAKARNVFSPRILVVEPGTSVLFESVDKGHNSASIKDMIPEGAEAWKGKISQNVEVAFEVPGFYGYACTPHTAMGMVGLIVVTGEGMMDNYEAVKGLRQRGKAADAFEEIWTEVEGMGILA